jgi:hypothetical protein
MDLHMPPVFQDDAHHDSYHSGLGPRPKQIDWSALVQKANQGAAVTATPVSPSCSTVQSITSTITSASETISVTVDNTRPECPDRRQSNPSVVTTPPQLPQPPHRPPPGIPPFQPPAPVQPPIPALQPLPQPQPQPLPLPSPGQAPPPPQWPQLGPLPPPQPAPPQPPAPEDEPAAIPIPDMPSTGLTRNFSTTLRPLDDDRDLTSPHLMAKINWRVIDGIVQSSGITVTVGAYADWHDKYCSAAILQTEWQPLIVSPVPIPRQILIPDEEWTNQSSFLTTRLRVPARLKIHLEAMLEAWESDDITLKDQCDILWATLSTTMGIHLKLFGPCPPTYGPNGVFVRGTDAPDPPRTTQMVVPQWAYWFIATFTQIVVFHWSTGTPHLASRDVAQLYIQLCGARRFRALRIPDAPNGMTYGVPRPDGTWFVPNTAPDGGAGTTPGRVY